MTLDKAALNGRMGQIQQELEQAVALVNKLVGQRQEVQTMLDYLATGLVSQEEIDAQVPAGPVAVPDPGLQQLSD